MASAYGDNTGVTHTESIAVNCITIRWPTGHREALADFNGKTKADHSAKRAERLRAQANDAPSLHVAQALCRDAAAERAVGAAHLASFNDAQAQARAIKSLVR